MTQSSIYTIYGIHISSNVPFHYPLLPGSAPVDVTFSCSNILPQDLLLPSPDSENIVTVNTPYGQQKVFLTVDDGSYLLHFTDHIIFHITARTITATIQHLPDPAVLDMLLFGPVLALWFFSKGRLGLHASAVSINDKAVIFTASNKSGKSSLASGCLQAGHAFLADDYAALTIKPAGYFIQPGYPQIRMWDDQAAAFFKHPDMLPIMREGYPKRLAPVGEHGLGTFCVKAKPLHVIYVPTRRDPSSPDLDTRITTLSKSAAVTALLRSGAVNYLRRWLPLHKQNLRLMAELVTHIPVKSLDYPSGYEHLPAVCDAVAVDVKNQGMPE